MKFSLLSGFWFDLCFIGGCLFVFFIFCILRVSSLCSRAEEQALFVAEKASDKSFPTYLHVVVGLLLIGLVLA
ncbi:MAG: hypothetical protein ACRELE_06020 [Gemmatimonadales bacterium]